MAIPKRHLAEFMARMTANDFDDLPDGAWWQVLEDTARGFMREKKLKGDENDATRMYLSVDWVVL